MTQSQPQETRMGEAQDQTTIERSLLAAEMMTTTTTTSLASMVDHHYHQRCRRTSRSRTRSRKNLLANCFLLSIVTLCELFIRQTSASGVFEFQLLDLDRLDHSLAPHQDHQAGPARPILVHVCLKEAFASQIDGPCAYGNITLTMNQRRTLTRSTSTTGTTSLGPHSSSDGTQQAPASMGSSNHINNTALGDYHQEDDQEDQEQLRRGSQMTNLVRMPFTFRWTVSSSEPICR